MSKKTFANAFDTIFSEYPSVCEPYITEPSTRHNVQHHIVTTGPPTFAKARRHSPEKLAAATAEFDQMLASKTVRLTSSNWASSLRMIPKLNGEWRPCDDYRALNAAALPDRNPIPHFRTSPLALAACTVFSKIDLVEAYHQIPVAPDCRLTVDRLSVSGG